MKNNKIIKKKFSTNKLIKNDFYTITLLYWFHLDQLDEILTVANSKKIEQKLKKIFEKITKHRKKATQLRNKYLYEELSNAGNKLKFDPKINYIELMLEYKKKHPKFQTKLLVDDDTTKLGKALNEFYLSDSKEQEYPLDKLEINKHVNRQGCYYYTIMLTFPYSGILSKKKIPKKTIINYSFNILDWFRDCITGYLNSINNLINNDTYSEKLKKERYKELRLRLPWFWQSFNKMSNYSFLYRPSGIFLFSLNGAETRKINLPSRIRGWRKYRSTCFKIN